jgi:elongation factor P
MANLYAANEFNREQSVPKASDLKRGDVVDIGGVPHSVKNVDAKSPSSRGASTLYKIRFTNLRTGQKLDESFKGDSMLGQIDCIRTDVQYSYVDGDEHVFMNTDDYSQYILNTSAIEDQLVFMEVGQQDLIALIVEGEILSVSVPVTVLLDIVETAPSIKGATASGRTKSATLTTGLVIQVPEYIETGERIKVNTESSKFVSRA